MKKYRENWKNLNLWWRKANPWLWPPKTFQWTHSWQWRYFILFILVIWFHEIFLFCYEEFRSRERRKMASKFFVRIPGWWYTLGMFQGPNHSERRLSSYYSQRSFKVCTSGQLFVYFRFNRNSADALPVYHFEN